MRVRKILSLLVIGCFIISVIAPMSALAKGAVKVKTIPTPSSEQNSKGLTKGSCTTNKCTYTYTIDEDDGVNTSGTYIISCTKGANSCTDTGDAKTSGGIPEPPTLKGITLGAKACTSRKCTYTYKYENKTYKITCKKGQSSCVDTGQGKNGQDGPDNLNITPTKTAAQLRDEYNKQSKKEKYNFSSVAKVTDRLGTDLIYIAGASVILLYAWAALLFVTAGSNTRNVQKAKDQAMRTTIGLIVIACVYLIQKIAIDLVSDFGA